MLSKEFIVENKATLDIQGVTEGEKINLQDLEFRIRHKNDIIEIYAELDGVMVGYAKFNERADKTLVAGKVTVDPDYRRQGIATAIYNYAEQQGYTVIPSETQTELGREFWKDRKNKQGVAEGSLNESAIFLNPNTVIVGQEHGRPLTLSPEIMKKVQAIAAKHGAWYEGNGADRVHTKGQIDNYAGSFDDEVAKTASPNDPKWLYVLFANVKENNRVQRVGVDPEDTIFNRLLVTAKDNSFQGIGFTPQALKKFLAMSSEGKYDFVKMSQQPATQENLTRFLKAGEALMWPDNWEQYPNKAGKIAKAATVDARDQYLASRKSGVYVVGSGHLKAVQQITGKQGVAEGKLDEAVGDNYLYHATQPSGMMRILRSGAIKASYRPQEATKSRTQYPTVSTTRSKQYAESDDFVNFLNLTKEGNSVIIVFDRNAVANHYKMFSTSQGTQTVGDEFEEVIVVPKGSMPIQNTMKGFYFNPKRTAEIEEFKDTPWFKELLNSPYYMGQKQGVAEY